MAYTTINKPTDYFNTVLYTGDGAASKSITGVGFEPNFIWIKGRSGADNHNLFDNVRGVQKVLRSNLTDAEVTYSNSLLSFDTDGFTVGTHTPVNRSGGTIVSWNWLGGGAGSSNTDGSITSSVSANTTSGFSIVSYTGTGANATIGHGLGVAPSMIITKTRSITQNWFVYHKSLGETKAIYLDLTNTPTTTSTAWNNTAPTSSVFSVGTEAGTNSSGATLIAYCFAEKKGYSKFGSYTGNGSTDGTFVYTGFKPAWVVVKSTSAGNNNNWMMHDNKRITYNPNNSHIYADLSNAEVTGSSFPIDILSNGFKLRNTNGGWNLNANNYIYMAFAEAPIVGTNNVPATSR